MRILALEGGLVLLIACCLVRDARLQPRQPLSGSILGGIGSVASTATNFLSSAVEQPRNLLINATRATTGYIDSAASRGLEFKLRRFLEKFRTRMRYGIPELGIPVLEPFRLDELDVDIDNQEIGNLSLIIEDCFIRDLSTFVIERAKLSLVGPRISVNLTIPRVSAEGYYNVSGVLGDVYPVYGAGPFRGILYDVRVYVDTVLGYSRGMYLKTLDIDFSLGAMDVYLENFMGGDDIGRVMSQVFQELTPQAVELLKPDVLPVIRDYIAGQANETIRHLTMRDILSVILGHNELQLYADLLPPSLQLV